jgi:hypothetical protein
MTGGEKWLAMTRPGMPKGNKIKMIKIAVII